MTINENDLLDTIETSFINVPPPDAPAVAGLSFRLLCGEQDADALYAVRVGCSARDQIDPLSTLEGLPSREQIAEMLSHAVAENQPDRWLAAQVDGQVVGYIRITSWREADGMWVYLAPGWVLPQWRGHGISTALLHWAEARIRRLAAVEHPNEKAEFAGNASSTEPEAAALLQHEGYTVGYTALEMRLDASTPLPALTPLPTGIEVRPALPEHYALIAASIDEAYRNEYAAGRFGEDFDAVSYAAELGGSRHDPSLWQIAWEGDQIAGQVLTVIERGRAEVFEVSVRPAWRRRGLARALLLRALHGLRGRGVGEMRLHTNDEFPTRAQDLYRSVGFRLLKEFPRYRKPFNLQVHGEKV